MEPMPSEYGLQSEETSKHTPMWKTLSKVHRWLTVLPNHDGSYIFLSEARCGTLYGSELLTNRVERILDGQNYVIQGDQSLDCPLWLDHTVLVWSVVCNETTQIWSIDMKSASPREQMIGCVPCVASRMKLQKLANAIYGLVFESTLVKIVEESHLAEFQGSGMLYTSFPLRFGKCYRPKAEVRSTIYFMLLERVGSNLRLSESPPLDILDGLDLRLRLWPNGVSFVLSPHGLLFSTERTDIGNTSLIHRELFYLEKCWLNRDGVSTITQLGWKTWTGMPHSFCVSHDGLFATFLQSQSSEKCFDHDSIFVVSLASPKHTYRVSLFPARQAADADPWNPRILSISWSSKNSSNLYAIIDEKGSMSVWKITLSQHHGTRAWNGFYMPIVRNGCTSSLFPLTAPGGQENLLVVRSTFDRAGVIEIVSMGVDCPARVDLIAEHCIPSCSATHDKISFQGAETIVSAFVHKPGSFDPNRRYATIIILHGGPNDAWRDCWARVWNPLLWTDQGYVVITPNISGSTGYGVPFASSIYQNWGNETLRDLECLFSYVETSMPFVDLSCVIGAGYSFGGYMMNWIAGNSLSARFCALIVHAGVFSVRNLLGGDLPVIYKADFGCFPWEDPEQWAKWDPSRLCHSWRTPVFFTHGDIDYRVPISESLAAYNTCQILGVPSQFLVFPDEGHTIAKSENLAQWQEMMIKWAERWVGDQPGKISK
ncbi:hypothetical protein M3J09_002037 [Ascochyta lentis]